MAKSDSIQDTMNFPNVKITANNKIVSKMPPRKRPLHEKRLAMSCFSDKAAAAITVPTCDDLDISNMKPASSSSLSASAASSSTTAASTRPSWWSSRMSLSRRSLMDDDQESLDGDDSDDAEKAAAAAALLPPARLVRTSTACSKRKAGSLLDDDDDDDDESERAAASHMRLVSARNPKMPRRCHSLFPAASSKMPFAHSINAWKRSLSDTECGDDDDDQECGFAPPPPPPMFLSSASMSTNVSGTHEVTFHDVDDDDDDDDYNNTKVGLPVLQRTSAIRDEMDLANSIDAFRTSLVGQEQQKQQQPKQPFEDLDGKEFDGYRTYYKNC